MARSIDYELAAIQNARFGEQVRSAIHDSIERCYDDVQSGVTVAQAVAERANTVVSDAETAASNAVRIANEATATLNNTINDFDSQVATKFNGYDNQIINKMSDVDSKILGITQKTDAANSATVRANNASSSIENLTVTYENVGPDTPGSVIRRTVDDHVDLLIKLRQGEKGKSNVVKGSVYASVEALSLAVPNPEEGDMYNVYHNNSSSPPYDVYRWTGSGGTWENQGQFGVNIDSITSSEIDTLWGGGSVSGSDSEYLNIAGLSNLISKVLVSLTSKVTAENGKGLISTADQTKLNGIETGAQVNVKPDWNAASGSAAEILNKPTIPAGVIVDTALSDSSPNAVQNKVIKSAIDAVVARHITIEPSSAFTPTWIASGDTNYPYYADLSANGIDSNWFVDVVFDATAVLSGVFSPVCESRSNAVRIWCKNNTQSSVAVKTISAWR